MRLIAPVSLLVLIGCTSGCLNFEPKVDTTRFFVFAPPTTNTPTLGGLAVSRVHLPDYLNRRSLAVRKSANEIVFAENIQWAEPLDRGMTRALTEHLRTVAPATGTITDVEVTVRQFDVTLEGNVVMEVDWVRGNGGLRTGRFTAQGPAPAKDPAGAIATMNQVVEMLAAKIAQGEGS